MSGEAREWITGSMGQFPGERHAHSAVRSESGAAQWSNDAQHEAKPEESRAGDDQMPENNEEWERMQQEMLMARNRETPKNSMGNKKEWNTWESEIREAQEPWQEEVEDGVYRWRYGGQDESPGGGHRDRYEGKSSSTGIPAGWSAGRVSDPPGQAYETQANNGYQERTKERRRAAWPAFLGN